MQYTKPMIDLVYEIRRRVSSNMKPGVKLANPELLKELASYYQESQDTITKTLIKELLHLAGGHWASLLEPAANSETLETTKQLVKVYRGQTILVEANHAPRLIDEAMPVAAKPTRLYRGQPVI